MTRHLIITGLISLGFISVFPDPCFGSEEGFVFKKDRQRFQASMDNYKEEGKESNVKEDSQQSLKLTELINSYSEKFIKWDEENQRLNQENQDLRDIIQIKRSSCDKSTQTKSENTQVLFKQNPLFLSNIHQSHDRFSQSTPNTPRTDHRFVRSSFLNNRQETSIKPNQYQLMREIRLLPVDKIFRNTYLQQPLTYLQKLPAPYQAYSQRSYVPTVKK